MHTPFLDTRHLTLVTVVLLLVLNGILLWRDYRSKQEFINVQAQLTDARIKMRVLESERVFGHSFIPNFETVDDQENVTVLPYFGTREMLVLFFSSHDCETCLQAISVFKSKISDNVPVVGVSNDDSISDIQRLKQKYGYEFPIFMAKDTPFRLSNSPYVVLIDRNRNVMHISSLQGSTNLSLLPERIEEITQIIERR